MVVGPIWLPRAVRSAVEPRAVAYDWLQLPFPPRRLHRSYRGSGDRNLLTEEEAKKYAEWVAAAEPGRAAYAADVLRACGAPIYRLPLDPEALVGLARWLRIWLPQAYTAWRGREWPVSADGLPLDLDSADAEQPTAVRLASLGFHSLTHDIAFVVVHSARNVDARLHWSASSIPIGVRVKRGEAQPMYRLPTLEPSVRRPLPIDAVYSFGLRTLTRPRPPGSGATTYARAQPGQLQLEQTVPLTQADDGALRRIYDDLLAERPRSELPPPSWPRLRREQLREKVLADIKALTARADAAGGTPAARPEHAFEPLATAEAAAIVTSVLSAVVAAYRAAGWFEQQRGMTDDELSQRLVTLWRKRTGSELLDLAGSLDQRILTLDGDRSLADDTEADVGEGEDAYLGLLTELGLRMGGHVSLEPKSEDWHAVAGGVIVRFNIDGTEAEVGVKDMGDVLDPAFISGLNAVLPESAPRFYFFDTGGQDFLVIRATQEERNLLQRLRPVQLLVHPPQWWCG